MNNCNPACFVVLVLHLICDTRPYLPPISPNHHLICVCVFF